MKVAVIQTAFPGDVILSTPLFEALRREKEVSETVAVVRPESACLLTNNPCVDRIVAFDKYGSEKGIRGIRKVASELAGCDKALIIQRHFRSALIALVAGIKVRVGFANSPARWLYTSSVRYRTDKHEVQRCLDLLGIDNQTAGYSPKIYLDDRVSEKARGLLETFGIGSDFAVVAAGSVWATKRYPHYARLIDLLSERLQIPVVLVGGHNDIPVSRAISEATRRKPFDLTGQTTLLESAAIISKAKLVIANDSAPAHMAAAVGTPVVAIFGPTSPAFGFSPYSSKSLVVDIGNLYCRPCTSHGSKRCPEKHFECMSKLAPEKVVSAAVSLLAG